MFADYMFTSNLLLHLNFLQNQVSPETLTSVDTLLDGTRGPESMLIPKFLEGLSGVTITQVSCGDLFAAVLTGKAPVLLTHPQF